MVKKASRVVTQMSRIGDRGSPPSEGRRLCWRSAIRPQALLANTTWLTSDRHSSLDVQLSPRLICPQGVLYDPLAPCSPETPFTARLVALRAYERTFTRRREADCRAPSRSAPDAGGPPFPADYPTLRCILWFFVSHCRGAVDLVPLFFVGSRVIDRSS